MEIFGGFMVMLSILGFFLIVVWFILPFVIFGIKGKVDRMFCLLEDMDKRLKALETTVKGKEQVFSQDPGQAENTVS
jgi:cytochrome b subunit of formate dehydrogenase